MKWIISRDGAGRRVDAWLAERPEVGSRHRAREWIERGKVFLNGDEVTFNRAGTRLHTGDEVAVWIDRPGSSRPQPRDLVTSRRALRVVFEDDRLLVLDKPPGMLVEPLPGDRSEITLRDLVADHLRSRGGHGAFVVHRIDRDTSGLVLFAKDERTRSALKRQFERRTAERRYLAVLSGRVADDEGTWTDHLVWDKARLVQRRARPDEETEQSGRRGAHPSAKLAVATYRILERFDEATLVEVRLVTGKRNQIRVQAGIRHHPLVGERIYTTAARAETVRSRSILRFPRQALHAARLAFRHPSTGTRVEFHAPVPADLHGLIERLRTSRGPVSRNQESGTRRQKSGRTEER